MKSIVHFEEEEIKSILANLVAERLKESIEGKFPGPEDVTLHLGNPDGLQAEIEVDL